MYKEKEKNTIEINDEVAVDHKVLTGMCSYLED